MIKEEKLTVTIMKYTSLDGTEFIADGPKDYQANRAKSLCEHQNLMYDFLHFKVDEEKLLNYNKENWLHFKWFFLRNYIFEAVWRNGTEYTRINNYSWMNNLEQDEFEEIILSSFLNLRYEKGTVIPRNLWGNEKFVEIIIESGIIKNHIDKKYKDNSILLTHLINRKNFESIKKYIDKGYYEITATDIKNSFDLFFKYVDEGNENMGTKHTISYERYYSKKTEKFVYKISNENRERLKYFYSKCVSPKEDILYIIMNDYEGSFSPRSYGAVVVFCEYFYKVSKKTAEDEAEKLYGYYLWVTNGKFYKNDTFKPNEDLIKVIISHSLHNIGDYGFELRTKEAYQDLLPYFKNKETELEVYFYWATNGRIKWATIHEILNKLKLRPGISWEYTYQELLDIASSTITKLNQNKEKLNKIKLEREKLDKEERKLIETEI